MKIFQHTSLSIKKHCLFVTEEIPITVSRRAPDKEARPSPLSLMFLGRRYHLTSLELWSAYFDLETYSCAHSPANPTTAHQECFELLDVSNRSTLNNKKVIKLDFRKCFSPLCLECNFVVWDFICIMSLLLVQHHVLGTNDYYCTIYKYIQFPNWME